MRKHIILLGVLLSGLFANAQSKNEVKVNILNTIVLASVELGYEHFLDNDQSIGVEFLINDRFSYTAEKSGGAKEFKTNSILASYNFYFGANGTSNSGYYVSPFLKYRFGDFNEKEVINDAEVTLTTDMNSFIIGFGTGYKWAWNDKFAIAPYANIARNFSSAVNDRFSAIEFNAGVSIGYRF